MYYNMYYICRNNVKMTKKNSNKPKGRVVIVSPEDNKLLRQYFIDADEMGCKLTNLEICSQMFKRGLHETLKDMNP